MTDSDDRRHVGVVVVNYGSSALLTRNLVALAGAMRSPSTVVVVDNPTTSEERRCVRDLAAQHGWEVVEPSRNLGFGGGVNVGASRALGAGATVLALLNPDLAIDAAAVEALGQVAEAHPDALVAPRIDRPDGSVWFAGARLDLATGFTGSERHVVADERSRWITGACVVLHRRAWELTGGFDERFFLYWEDVDLSHRVVVAGGELIVCDDLRAVHDVGGTQPGVGRSTTYVYYNCRNRLLFASVHVPPRRRLAWLVGSPRYAARVLSRDGRRAALRRPDLAWAAARGTLAGAWSVVRSLVPRSRDQRTDDSATATISSR